MARSATVLYGITVYVLFPGTISCAIGFVGDFALPETLESAPRAASAATTGYILVDLLHSESRQRP